MKHLLLYAVLWLCAGVALATEAPGLGDAGAPASTPGPAVQAASRELPVPNEAEYTDQINAWLEDKRRMQEENRAERRRNAIAAVSVLVAGFLGLLLHTGRSGRSTAFKVSRVLLWAPLFMLAGAWYFPPILLGVLGFAPVLLGICWRRALSWWELSIACAVYLAAMGGLWVMFSVLAGLGRGL